jgi:Outer membrane protein beta-barrel domain
MEVFEHMKLKLSAFLALVGFAFVALPSFAQSVEIDPYGGYYWSGANGSGPGRFFNNQLLGVRGGGYITHSFELGGNYSWSNHFQPNPSNTGASLAGDLGFAQGAVRANLWEVEYTYNFAKRSLFGSPTVRPYVVGGTGGITTRIKNEDEFVLNVIAVNPQRTKFVPNDVLENDTFFTFSYGGGVKAMRIWGPMGFFGDFRGRTIPNFFSSTTTRPELSAGLTFSWGER